MPQFGDDIYLGPALGPNPEFSSSGNPAPMSQGVGPMGRVYVWDVVPAAPVTNCLATAQAVGAAGNLALTFSLGGVTRVTRPDGSFGYVLDCPRAVVMVSSGAGDTTQTATISGFDYMGAAMTARITLNGVSPVSTLKAFKSITQIAMSAACAGNVSAGTNSVLGIPVRVTDRGYTDPSWNNTLARDAGTLVVADQTSPATLTTGDVRGTYLPSSAADGSKRLIMGIMLPALAVGPQATRIGAFGVPQV